MKEKVYIKMLSIGGGAWEWGAEIKYMHAQSLYVDQCQYATEE